MSQCFNDFCISGLAGISGHHQNVAFQKSKALQGVISGIPRSRVNELVNPDPERPLAPAWRVSWMKWPKTNQASSVCCAPVGLWCQHVKPQWG